MRHRRTTWIAVSECARGRGGSTRGRTDMACAGWKRAIRASPRRLSAKYGLEVPASMRSLKMTPVRTSIRSPWQNGVAERWVGSCRRDLLDHVIALDERHLKRLVSEYVSY